MNSALCGDINQLIREIAPESLAIISQEATPVFEHAPENTHYIENPADYTALSDLPRVELAVVLLALDSLPRKLGEQILGRLRTLHTQRLLVATQSDTWAPSHFYAFAMTAMNHYVDDGQTIDLYEYNIHSYKSVPDWLNNKFWANPKMWDKYRW